MEAQHRFELDDITYVMTPENAMTAYRALKKAAVLLSEAGPSGYTLMGSVMANLGSEELEDLEKVILRNTTVGADKPYRLSDQLERHFNQYREHLVDILVEGFIYQFSPFFNGLTELIMSMDSQAPVPTRTN